MSFYCKNLPAPHPTSCIHYVNKKSLYLDARTIKALRLAETGHMSQQLHTLYPFGLHTVKVNAHKKGYSETPIQNSWAVGVFFFKQGKSFNLSIQVILTSMPLLRGLLGDATPVVKHSPYTKQCKFSLRSLRL